MGTKSETHARSVTMAVATLQQPLGRTWVGEGVRFARAGSSSLRGGACERRHAKRFVWGARLLAAPVFHCGSLATAPWVSVGRSPMDGVLCARSRLLEETKHGRAGRRDARLYG